MKVTFVRTVDIVFCLVLKLVGILDDGHDIALRCQEVFRSADEQLAYPWESKNPVEKEERCIDLDRTCARHVETVTGSS